MLDNKENELNLEPEIKRRIEKISKLLNISFSKVLNASIFDGIDHYFLPLQKYLAQVKVEDQPVKEKDYEPILSDLKEQIESSNIIIQKIDEFEPKFEKKYLFGTFQDLDERHREFIKFIEESSKPKESPVETHIEEPIPRKVAGKIKYKKPLPPKPIEQAEETETFLKICIDYLTPQIHGIGDIISLIIYLLLSFSANFYFFRWITTIWPILNFEYFLRFYPFFVPFQIILIPGIFLLISFIIGKLWYYPIHKIKNSKKNIVAH